MKEKEKARERGGAIKLGVPARQLRDHGWNSKSSVEIRFAAGKMRKIRNAPGEINSGNNVAGRDVVRTKDLSSSRRMDFPQKFFQEIGIHTFLYNKNI